MTSAASVPHDVHFYFGRAKHPEACLLALHYSVYFQNKQMLQFAGAEVFEADAILLRSAAYMAQNWPLGVRRPVTLNADVVNAYLMADIGRVLGPLCSAYDTDIALTMHDDVHGRLLFWNICQRSNMALEPRACPPHQVWGWDNTTMLLPAELLKRAIAA